MSSEERLNINELLHIVNILDTLHNIPRVGWVQRGINKVEAEDVGRHILLTCYVGLSLCCRYRELCDENVSCEDVITQCLIHDLHEASIGNISGNVRKMISNFKNIELRQLEDLTSILPKSIKRFIGTKFLNYRETKSLEALLTNLADKLSTLLRALRYYLNGFRNVMDLIHTYSGEVLKILNYIKCEKFSKEVQNIVIESQKIVSQ